MKNEKLNESLKHGLDFKGIFENSNQKGSSISRDKSKLMTPVQAETSELDSIESNIKDVNRIYQREIDRKWGFFEKMSNKSMYDQVVAVKSELVQQSGQYRIAYYRTILDTRLESLNERCNAGLKMIKAYYRKEVSSFLMSKMEELSIEVREKQFTFLELMKAKYEYAEDLDRYPSMKEKFMEQIYFEEGRYLSFLDSQLENFENIVVEEIKKYY